MSLMSALYVGSSGLRVSQNALNTTAHNVSNAETTGYTRQQVAESDIAYQTIQYNYRSVSKQQLGLGVAYASTRQVRDYFLDQTYRKESGRSAFYEVSYDAMNQLENIMGEPAPADNSYQKTINDLWTSIQELAKDPADSVNQGLFVQRSNQFLEQSLMVYDELRSYQMNLNDQVKDAVDQINEYGNRIKELNDEILMIEAGNVEKANDLRDERNLCIDKLSSLCNIAVTSDVYGNSIVTVEGASFVGRDQVYEIGAYRDVNGFYTPYWVCMAGIAKDENGNIIPNLEASRVVNTDRRISSDINTDIGKLESLLYARGDHTANYTELAEDKYPAIEQSILMNTQAEFDQLFHGIVTAINDVLYEAATNATAKWGDMGYMCYGTDGLDSTKYGKPLVMFEKVASADFTRTSPGSSTSNWQRNEEDVNVPETLITLGNIVINEDLMKQPTLLSFVTPDGETDFETAEKLAQAFDAEEHILNPNLKSKANFSDYYINLVTQVANSGSVYKSLTDAQQKTLDTTENARQEVIGVSTDEELTFMIKFQNAYNASSRYINAVNELLDHLVNAM